MSGPHGSDPKTCEIGSEYRSSLLKFSYYSLNLVPFLPLFCYFDPFFTLFSCSLVNLFPRSHVQCSLVPRSHVPLFPCSLVPLFPCSLVPLFPCSLVPLFPCSLVPLFPRSLVPLFPRSLVPLFPCSLFSLLSLFPSFPCSYCFDSYCPCYYFPSVVLLFMFLAHLINFLHCLLSFFYFVFLLTTNEFTGSLARCSLLYLLSYFHVQFVTI